MASLAAMSTLGTLGSITFLYSATFDASRKFYEEGLGLPIRSNKGAVVFYALPGTACSLGVVKEGISAAQTPPCSAKTAGRDTVMLCLLTDQVDNIHSRLSKMEACEEVQKPQENTKFGIYNSLVRDPDGYLIELQQFLDPAEQRLFTGRG